MSFSWFGGAAEAQQQSSAITDIAGSETLTPSITESSAVKAGASGTETLTPSLTESTAVLVFATAADTLTPSIADISEALIVPDSLPSSALVVLVRRRRRY